MATYIILSRLAPDAFAEPKDFKKLANTVSARIKKECPGVKWRGSYITLGRFDIVDVVESDDPSQIEKAIMLIRGSGHAVTETMLATPWKEAMSRY